ncbi:HAD-IIIA family hydrolase [Pseudoalteromonas agarivorans]|uniref:KdsC family phosphatase n=1 Tax=Pseudoalteromonas TaxID=53246 RepID=UPI000F75A44F|nr:MULTISPECIES: HAD-IIIA family hydrolase [Pseudoalteromonas]AZN31579.1 HAD-IIIA family hydrolase [Pseudoalteromonas sp. Xi13]MCQ8822206.1 HAD-IIIA family hydrolase [Pseudoalteromonas agarivorans]
MKNIELILFDVDGVMTDGSIYIDKNGESFKKFNVKDGLAIELLRSHNIKTGVVSGKASKALTLRSEKLGFDFIVTGCKNKLPRVHDICTELNIGLDKVAFVGDDVLDLPVMQKCGASFAPSDAHELVLNYAQYITNAPGGGGVVREVADKVLLARFETLDVIYDVLLDKIISDDVKNMEQ